MRFDLDEFLLILNPGTILTVAAVGAVLGSLFFRDRRAQGGYLLLFGFGGLVFVGTMTVVRLVQGAESWEAWPAIGLLWLFYGAGTHAGSIAGQLMLRRRRPRE